MTKKNSIIKEYGKYVSLNIFGMIGLSCYILADTFFVSSALGAKGLAALNLSIPIYSVIHGIGLMIGIGGATRYSILKSQKEYKRANINFTHCLGLGVVIGVILICFGIFGTGRLSLLLGADASTLPLAKAYLTLILCFAPFFITNNILIAFVRNDDNPKLAMTAMLVGSFSNVLLDYLFVFPLNMGMFGAALATGIAPVISIGVLFIHVIKKNNQFKAIRCRVSWAYIRDIVCLGASAFITEISSAVVLITFNLVILKLEGNIGVAAYGIVANLALVGIAIFIGIAQGIQPLVSKKYGENNVVALNSIIRLAIITSLSAASIIYVGTFLASDIIIKVFNSEQNIRITELAKTGLRIYFIGFFFAGVNIIMAAYFSAVEKAKRAFVISILRGFIVIIPMVLLLSKFWMMEGVWSAFVLTELTVLGICIIGGIRNIQ